MYNYIYKESKELAIRFNIDDRLDCLAMRSSTLGHKPNFHFHPRCRLIDPSISEIGIICKRIIDTINSDVRRSTGLTQWDSIPGVVNRFCNIENKSACTFTQFDICAFYPSISKLFHLQVLIFSEQYTNISDLNIRVIRKSILALTISSE